MKTLKYMVIYLTIVMISFLLQTQAVYADTEYITDLDITVIERDDGEVAILQIGRYSPFRRYSWFRVGDVIVEVNGMKSTTFILNTLRKNQEPYIKYKRGSDPIAERQISLEQPVYGLPPYLNRK